MFFNVHKLTFRRNLTRCYVTSKKNNLSPIALSHSSRVSINYTYRYLATDFHNAGCIIMISIPRMDSRTDYETGVETRLVRGSYSH